MLGPVQAPTKRCNAPTAPAEARNSRQRLPEALCIKRIKNNPMEVNVWPLLSYGVKAHKTSVLKRPL